MFADYTIVMYQVMFSHDSYKKPQGIAGVHRIISPQVTV